jgi:tRNA(fMet)-specific endonuclease VapC
VTARLIAAPRGSIYLCSVVLAELFYGAIHGGSAHQAANLALIAKVRQQFVSVPFDDRAAEEYGKLRAYLSAHGTIIGSNDLMIAAIALANQMTLVTHNTIEIQPRAGVESGRLVLAILPRLVQKASVTIGGGARLEASAVGSGSSGYFVGNKCLAGQIRFPRNALCPASRGVSGHDRLLGRRICPASNILDSFQMRPLGMGRVRKRR